MLSTVIKIFTLLFSVYVWHVLMTRSVLTMNTMARMRPTRMWWRTSPTLLPVSRACCVSATIQIPWNRSVVHWPTPTSSDMRPRQKVDIGFLVIKDIPMFS